MKNTYIAVSVQENNKNYAYTIKVNETDNLLSKIKIKGIKFATVCESKKRCEEIVNSWNKDYRNNNTYMFP